jgi:arylsulfatase A-like enzyme
MNHLLHGVVRIMLVGLVLATGTALAQDKPNILVVWGDDIGQSNISTFTRGVMGYRTPNIDRIASEGMAFTVYPVAYSADF